MYHTSKHYTSISDIAAVLVYRMFLWCVKIYDCYVLCKVAMVVYNTHVQLFKKLLNNFCSCLVCCFDIKLTITISVLGRCIGTLRGHDDEVLDVAFDYTGQMLLTASADGTARCYNAVSHNLISKFEGHEGEISKVKNMKQFSVSIWHQNIYVFC